MTFSPRLDLLPGPQRRLWDELSALPDEFVLYEGTAIALHLGHRQSVDFDFFGSKPLDQRTLLDTVPFLTGAIVTQIEPNTLGCTVKRGGEVKLSFFGVPSVPRLLPPLVAPGNELRVASLVDLAGMKASVIQLRAEAKDHIDIDALMTTGGIDLPTALAAARAIYGTQFNPQSTLKALSYFEDGKSAPPAASHEGSSGQCRTDHRSHRSPVHRQHGWGRMKAIPVTTDTLSLARRLIWFEAPEEALADPIRFMAYAFARATSEDMRVLRSYLSDDDLREALDQAPPGIVDPRSWAYWNSKLGRYPAPPMPQRRLG